MTKKKKSNNTATTNASRQSAMSSSISIVYPMFRRQMQQQLLVEAQRQRQQQQVGSTTADDPIEDIDDSSSSSDDDDDDDDINRFPLSVIQERMLREQKQQKQQEMNNRIRNNNNNLKRKSSTSSSSSLTTNNSNGRRKKQSKKSSIQTQLWFAPSKQSVMNNIRESSSSSSSSNNATKTKTTIMSSGNVARVSTSTNTQEQLGYGSSRIATDNRLAATARRVEVNEAVTATTQETGSSQPQPPRPSSTTTSSSKPSIPDSGEPKRLRRFVSDISMDYIPVEDPTAKPTSNILSYLIKRTTTVPTTTKSILNAIRPNIQKSNRVVVHPPTSTTIGKKSIPWINPKWVQLVKEEDENYATGLAVSSSSAMAGNYYSNKATKVEHICWDSMGVLLTVATSNPSKILIYDWDMVRAADIQGKQQKQRNQFAQRLQKQQQQQQQQQQRNEVKAGDGSSTCNNVSSLSSCCVQVPPIMEFNLPYLVSSIGWNPIGDCDELAVGFRHSQGKTHLYNVNAVSKWQQEQRQVAGRGRRNNNNNNSWSTQNHQQQLYPPSSTYHLLQSPRSQPSIECILFVKRQQQDRTANKNKNNNKKNSGIMIVVSVGTMIYCYHQKHTNDKNDSYSLYWRCQFSSTITSIVCVGGSSSDNGNKDACSYLVVGTKSGHISVLDAYRRTREDTFSMNRRPVFVLKEQRYIPSVYLQQQQISKSNQKDYWKIVKLEVDATPTTATKKSGITNAPSSSSGRDKMNDCQVMVRCRLRWVTASGWVLSTWLQQKQQQEQPKQQQRWMMVDGHVLYEPPKVQYRNSETGSIVEVAKSTWSNTLSVTKGMIAVVGGGSSSSNNNNNRPSSLWFPTIPRHTQVMAPHDKYVLASTTTTTASTAGMNTNTAYKRSSIKQQDWYLQHNPALSSFHDGSSENDTLIDSTKSTAVAPISMSMALHNGSSSSSSGSRPHVIAVHQDTEWMVLGVENQLAVMLSRSDKNNNQHRHKKATAGRPGK